MTDQVKTETPVIDLAAPQTTTAPAADPDQPTHPLHTTESRAELESDEHFTDAAEQPLPDTNEDEAEDGMPAPLPATADAIAPQLTRQTSEAIGPDLPTPMLESQPHVGMHIQFILLLASAGTRHPFQLNEKYLNKRNVKATGPDDLFDPSTISVYTLKELIFRDWRDDWETKPSSPSAIRLIFFGQMLADNTSLRECRILPNGSTHVLHISIKPQEVMDDEEAHKGGKASVRRGREGGSGGCSCVIL